MEINLFISFVIVSVGLIIVPGPNVLVIVSTSLAHGKARGLQTVAGTTLAMAVQLVIAVAGTAGFIQVLTNGFVILKWLGIAYLGYLGLRHLKQAIHNHDDINTVTASSSFTRGFIVSLTNPKTILFFSAFLPQFASEAGDYLMQVSLLSVTFLLLAAVLDSCYAVLSARLQSCLTHHRYPRIKHGICGGLFLGASAWLATARRTQ